MPFKQNYTFQVRAYEISPAGTATMATICNYLQEAAGMHAEELDVASPQLHKQGITWVLARLHVKMKKLPRWLDKVSLTTWPAQLDRLYAVRDFILEQDGEAIGVATSAWVLIDLKSRRSIRRFPDQIIAVHPEKPLRSLDDPFRKLNAVAAPGYTNAFPIRSHDLDMNNHVNNTVFISLLQDNLLQDVQTGYSLTELQIDFRGEAFAGDTLIGCCETSGQAHEFIHSLLRNENGPEIIRAVTKLAKY